MKKKNIFILIVLLAILMINTKVSAATCSNSEKQALVVEAQNVVVNTELRKVTPGEGISEKSYFYSLIISNTSDKLYYEIGINRYDSKDADKNGDIILKDFFSGGGTQAKVSIYGNSNSACNNVLIRTVALKLPYFNYYSEREECKGLENYPICKKESNTADVTEEQFLQHIADAKAKEEEKNRHEETKEESTFEKMMSYVKENLVIVVGISIVIIVIVIVIIVLVLKKRKNKVKIDLGDK